MRSVSLTRQLAMLVRRVLPSAYSAITASVIAASGMWLQSSVMAFSGQAPRRTSSQPAPPSTWAPIARAASTKRMSPWIESRPTPSMRTGASTPASAPSATKYDADDASASTWIAPGDQYCEPRGSVKLAYGSAASRSTTMPKRASRFSVMSM